MIPQDSALTLQLAMIAGDEPERSYLEVRWRRPQGWGQSFRHCQESAAVLEQVAALAPQTDVYVGAAPRVARRGKIDAVARVWCVWCDCDSAEAVARLRTFEPRPSLVIRSGSAGHLHAWWALSHPLRPSFAKAANRRLARHLAADVASADVARVLRPAGTLNHKHDPPGAVECVWLRQDTYRAPEIVGQLGEDPAVIPRSRPKAPPPAADCTAAVLGVLGVVRDAPNGERNARLFWASCRMGEKVAAGELGDASAAELLRASAAVCGLLDEEPGTTERTIRSGLDAGGAA